VRYRVLPAKLMSKRKRGATRIRAPYAVHNVSVAHWFGRSRKFLVAYSGLTNVVRVAAAWPRRAQFVSSCSHLPANNLLRGV
jgi:hypothetical protein